MKKDEMRDLGLTYEEAAHGVQTAMAVDIAAGKRATEPKHLRVGIDMSKSDMLGLAMLLMDKGVFTSEEYVEYMRLAANEEVAMREDVSKYGPGPKVSFR